MYLTLTKKSVITIILGIIIITFGCIFVANYTNTQILAGSSKNTNWGLGFSTKNEPPTGNATSEFLKQYNSYYIGDTTKKTVYITFDAGYENGNTPAILKALKKHNIKATFFVVGTYIKSNPDLIKQMIEEGHIIANHTQTHPDMSKMSTMEDFKKEIEPVEEVFKQVTGKDMPKFYRPPRGVYSETNLQMANQLGYKTIFWSLAYVDWYQDKQPTHQEAFDKILPRIHNGCVLLLHSTSKTNAEILDELLTKLENMGYTFGTLNDLN